MIDIKEKKDCCGCSACVQICPKQCIDLSDDDEGFSYPLVDLNKCIDCSLCEHVCPVIHQAEIREPLKVYAAKSKDEQIKIESSSGGVFSLIAEYVIKKGGVVFGAKFDEKWDVIHDYTESIDGLKYFRGSKYVQSIIGNTYYQARSFLKQGRLVLFSGTPCQIAGLNLFLKKGYTNLLTIDFICHGVPSPKVWKLYKTELLNEYKMEDHFAGASFTNISFRDKSNGWKEFSFSAEINIDNNKKQFRETLRKNIYMKGFLKDLYLRPACHYCPTKSLKSDSNITIADFWGIQHIIPDFEDDKGVSLIILNKHIDIDITQLNMEYREVEYNEMKKYNRSIEISVKPHKKREYFFTHIKDKPLSEVITTSLKVSPIEIFFMRSKKVIRTIINKATK